MPDPNPNRDPKTGRFAPKGRGGGLAALAVVLAVAAGGGGAAVGSAVSGTGTSAGRPASGTQARARDRSTQRAVQRLTSQGLQVTRRAVAADDDCAANSYGQVQDFFRQNPCTALYRALFEVRDGPATALIAVSWVDMPTEAQAQQYQQLVDRQGTGNATELSDEVSWTGLRYVSTRDGVTVVNAQAEPVGATADAVDLARRAAGTAVS